MAKKTVASIQKGGGKAFAKVVKMVKSDNGSYSFKEGIVPNEMVDSFFKN